jgi:hypothetical protein
MDHPIETVGEMDGDRLLPRPVLRASDGSLALKKLS